MDSQIFTQLPAFALGLLVGVLLVVLYNKVRGGGANPAKTKQEFENYQAQVEQHFQETGEKFQSITKQYQELYEHMAVGATSLCRPDTATALLSDQGVGEQQGDSAADESTSAIEDNMKPADKEVAEAPVVEKDDSKPQA
ncbi:MAG: DUF1043 family protein [Pseudomonadota bacterium]